MRKPLITALVALVAFLAPLAPSASAGGVDAGRGNVQVFEPAAYDPSEPTPLVMLLHGYGSNGVQQESYMRFLNWIDTFGFLFVRPGGTMDGAGNRFWNGTNACCDFNNTNIDDSGYLRALIDAVKAQYNVDERRVWIVGHSNGGFMSYRMACDHPDTVAAIASLAGASWNNPAQCAPDSPVHVLQIHGTADNTIQYGGGNIFGNAYPSAQGSAEQWAAFDGCQIVADTSPTPINLDTSISGDETMIARYASDCRVGGSAELWTIQGGGHVPALGSDFARLVLEYFYAHPAPLGERHCATSPNSAGAGALLWGAGSETVADDDVTLVAEGLPAQVTGLFYLGQNVIQVPFGDGLRCIGGATARLNPPVASNAMGVSERAVSPLSAPAAPFASPGSSTSFQLWYRDTAAGGSGFNLSDAVRITWR